MKKLRMEQLERRELLTNLLLILSDDQRIDTLGAMPKTTALLGTSYTQSRATTPLCCPSRASILTGQYASAHGVHTNVSPDGGFAAFDDTTTIATVLHNAGYKTGLVGKYLNGYPNTPTPYVPPGWDTWRVLAGDGATNKYNYRLTDVQDGVVAPTQTYGTGAANYNTDVLSQKAVDFLMGTEANDSQPWFLMVAPVAPHAPYQPAPRHAKAPVILPPTSPALNEADVSDKPTYVRNMPLLTANQLASLVTERRNELRSLMAVDEMVQRLHDVLVVNDEWSDTLVIYTSDHGLQRGEHRLMRKDVPYEESLRVPFLTNRPAIDTSALVLNIDIAPTLAAAAGVVLPGAHGVDIAAGVTRTDFLVQGWSQWAGVYVALHTGNTIFISYFTGKKEYYDLVSDPYQLASDLTLTDVAGNLARISDILAGL